MKLCAAFGTSVFAFAAGAAEPTTLIRLNAVGYLPAAEKRASVGESAAEFSIVRAGDGEQVYSGRATGPIRNADTDEELWFADFSAVTTPGQYRLEMSGVGVSAEFRIADDVYDEPLYLVTRAMYLWRCGTAVRGEHEGAVFAHAACHLEDGWMDPVTGKHEFSDGTGGWHDAGDYNKYVPNAGITVGVMLRAWDDFRPALEKLDLDLPESGGGLPDFLAEIKWETEWLLKMQAEDGSVYHKLSTREFSGFVLPEAADAPRYFLPWSSVATADFVAILAAASRAFRPYDEVLADRYLAAARLSYDFLQAHPDAQRPDMAGFETGRYLSPDREERLWAAAEMWATVGEAAMLADLEARIRAIDAQVDEEFDWGNETNLALFTYLFSEREGRDDSLVAAVRRNLIATADALVTASRSHGYARPLGSHYSWGGNGDVARLAITLRAAHRVEPDPAYSATALDALNHLLGRNVHGRSYVTALGFKPPQHPHDRRMGADQVDAPWPGYLMGGPNPGPADWFDEEASYRTNETAINWNSALIYALAGFVGDREW